MAYRRRYGKDGYFGVGGDPKPKKPAPPPAADKQQPTAEGYWWTRPDSGCMWRMVEISIHGGRTYIEEMGEEGQDLLPACPWWEWVGPIAPPKS